MTDVSYWDRVATDPALLAEARCRYRGDGDVADQLWWSEHPGEDSPAGLPDPAVHLRTVRRELYRQDVRPEEVLAARMAEAAQIENRVLARLALLEALTADRPVAAAAAPPPAPAAAGPGPARRSAARRIGAVLAAVALLGAGFGIGRAAAPEGAAPAGSARAYDVLRRPQRPADRIAEGVRPGFIRPSSTRLIARYHTIGTTVYAARASSGRLCLVTVVLGSRLAGACTTDAGFGPAGLFLQVQASADPVDDSGHLPSDQVGIHWHPDGRVTIGSER